MEKMDGDSATNFILKPDPESGDDDDAGVELSGGKMEGREADVNRSMKPQPTKQDHSNWETLVLAYQSLGVVYGDLGTSPVNVFSATNLTNLTEDDLLGTLSLIIWTLTILVLVKYVFIVLHANDHGEGGTFALYSYICRHLNFKSSFTIQNTRPVSDSTVENYGGGRGRGPISTRSKEFLERSYLAQNFLTIVVLLGTCMVIGDGALTPATCVLPAVQGIRSRSSKITQGAEAMFADLGHFNKRAIQLGFSLVVYPSLILTYAGETAYLVKHPENITDAYYSSLPNPVYWPMFVISTLAAVVSSQSMISACFSIIKQSLVLGCFPRVDIVHTSSENQGQVYSPQINCILLILTVALVVGFRGGVELANAYGVVVIWVMIITTFLMSFVMLVIWNTNIILVLGFLFPFVMIEIAFMSSLLKKIPQGGWVPFAISVFFMIVMLSWTYGRSKKTAYDDENKMSIRELDDALSATSISRMPGVCFFFTDLVYGIPPIVRHYIHHTNSAREIMVLVTVKTLLIKAVAPEERLHVGKLGGEGVYRCLIQFGYYDDKEMNGVDYVDSIAEKIIEMIDDTTEKQKVRSAIKRGIKFVTGRTILKASKKSGIIARFTIDHVYRFLQKNSRPAVSSIRTPSEATLQVGMLYEI